MINGSLITSDVFRVKCTGSDGQKYNNIHAAILPNEEVYFKQTYYLCAAMHVKHRSYFAIHFVSQINQFSLNHTDFCHQCSLVGFLLLASHTGIKLTELFRYENLRLLHLFSSYKLRAVGVDWVSMQVRAGSMRDNRYVLSPSTFTQSARSRWHNDVNSFVWACLKLNFHS